MNRPVASRGLNRHFNLYYLHWWTLTYFVFETPQHRERALALVQRGGGLDTFEQLIGPVDTVQTEWHAYVRRLKAALAGSDLEFFKKAKGRTAGDGKRGFLKRSEPGPQVKVTTPWMSQNLTFSLTDPFTGIWA